MYCMYCMYCMYLNPTHRVANKLLSLKKKKKKKKLRPCELCYVAGPLVAVMCVASRCGSMHSYDGTVYRFNTICVRMVV